MGHILSPLAGALCPVMRRLVLKRDSELPWVVRLARWAGLSFSASYGALLLAEKFKEVFYD